MSRRRRARSRWRVAARSRSLARTLLGEPAGKVSPAEEIGTTSSSNSGVPLILLSLALLSHSQMPSLHSQAGLAPPHRVLWKRRPWKMVSKIKLSSRRMASKFSVQLKNGWSNRVMLQRRQNKQRI